MNSVLKCIPGGVCFLVSNVLPPYVSAFAEIDSNRICEIELRFPGEPITIFLSVYLPATTVENLFRIFRQCSEYSESVQSFPTMFKLSSNNVQNFKTMFRMFRLFQNFQHKNWSIQNFLTLQCTEDQPYEIFSRDIEYRFDIYNAYSDNANVFILGDFNF